MSSDAPTSAPSTGLTRAFVGDSRRPWSLRHAVDALAESARAAGRPGLIWLAGVGYPTLGASIATGWLSSIFALEQAAQAETFFEAANTGLGMLVREGFLDMVVFLPVMFIVWRLRAGLARIAPPAIWDRLSETFGHARLRQAWRAGRGQTLSTCGMALMLNLMMSGVLMLVVSPIMYLLAGLQRNLGDGVGAIGWLTFVMPCAAVLTLYAVLLSVLHQLGLQSLAHNRRGVSSALIHAWRIAKNDPWCTFRTVAVDLMIDVTIFALALAVGLLGGVVGQGWIAVPLVFALYGFVGVTRACYWARAYRAMGGLSPDDQVPGLADASLEI